MKEKYICVNKWGFTSNALEGRERAGPERWDLLEDDESAIDILAKNACKTRNTEKMKIFEKDL